MNTPDLLRSRLAALLMRDEESCVSPLIPLARQAPEIEARIHKTAESWVREWRASASHAAPMERLLHRFRLTDKEGLALMTLAEALPRIADDETADALIASKLSQGDWRHYLEHYPDLISKAAWLGLSLGRDVSVGNPLSSWVSRISQGALREAMRMGMKKLGQHFVLGATMGEAITRSLKKKPARQRYSFDILGEAARTQEDADRYFNDYKQAILSLGSSPEAGNGLFGPSISVKLSALHPRYEWAQVERVKAELLPRLLELIESAASQNVGITIDAEESERLELSLTLLEVVFAAPVLKHYPLFGCAVQAYQKRAPAVIDWLHSMAKAHGVRITVRLVKGAYWDSEIKRAQERGLAQYPVYTRKEASDIAFLACARKLLDSRPRLFPQFGTHNALTLLAVKEMAGNSRDYEIQRLHGMGEDAHQKMMDEGIASCVYAPVGDHKRLLSYLIRRLLENSANSSFVNQLHHPEAEPDTLLANPVALWKSHKEKAHPAIPLPRQLYGTVRTNSEGINLSEPAVTRKLEESLATFKGHRWTASPYMEGCFVQEGSAREITNPAQRAHIVGECVDAIAAQASTAIIALNRAFPAWSTTPIAQRATLFERLAAKLEEGREELIALLCFEAGKTIGDALSEVREAADFCRYYAAEAQRLFSGPEILRGVNGELNQLSLHGRGVFVCISPWNFPLAITLGQVAAALLAGNTVAMKPAEQTPLIAARLLNLILKCGLPPDVIALLPGDGEVGAALTREIDLGGVAFTGSTTTARAINRSLAAREGAIVPLIAETGGINALIADASALPEQLVDDIVTSAFRSAGQRCSAARLLCLQDCMANDVLTMLRGALSELRLGDPAQLRSDVGPVIDGAAMAMLQEHERRLKAEARFIGAAPLPADLPAGTFIAPQAWEIPSPFWLTEEVFGPILHVVRYKTGTLPLVIDQINALGYGLTGGFHSRIDSAIDHVKKHWRVGNLYINRSQIGAVVGVQPFGGDGLSGTGPKAGGPHYLTRFASERATSINLAASGGSVDLLGL